MGRPFTLLRQLAIRRAGHSRIQDRYLLDLWPAATAEINVECACGVIKPFHHFRLLVGCDSSKPSSAPTI